MSERISQVYVVNQPISGTGGNVNLTQVGGGLIALGQAAMAASLPVVIASNQTPINVTSKASDGTLTDHSGSITTGGTAQALMAVNANRKYLIIQNVSGGDLWFNFTTTAVISQPSLKLISGATFTMENNFVSTEAISIIGASTSQAFTAKEG